MAPAATRYKPTPLDVLYALRVRYPDPFGHNDEPITEFRIASDIASIHQLGNYAVGRLIQRDSLRLLLEAMTNWGVLVARTRAEWADLGRVPPSQGRDLLYTTASLDALWTALSRTAAQRRNAAPTENEKR